MSKIFLVILLILPWSSYAGDNSGLEISLAGDMVFEKGIASGSEAENRLAMRGMELMFFAPVDTNFDGTFSAAAHDEDGESVFELHESFLSSNKIIPRGRFKVGQFFLGVGRLNQVHQHDWPFIQTPKVHEEFFDSEGVIDSGVEFGYLLPTSKYWDLTLGVTSGHRYGHSYTTGPKPKTPTHYLRIETFREFSSTDGLKVGFNYLGRTDELENATNIGGFDFVAKWRDGKRLRYLLQGETWYRLTVDAAKEQSRQAGLYVFNQFGISEELLLGLRLDGYKDLTKTNSTTGDKVDNFTYNIAPELTWKSSEFALIRAGLSHEFTREDGKTIEEDSRFNLQLVFVMGTHPAHSF